MLCLNEHTVCSQIIVCSLRLFWHKAASHGTRELQPIAFLCACTHAVFLPTLSTRGVLQQTIGFCMHAILWVALPMVCWVTFQVEICFVDFLNSFYQNIQFTVEMEQGGKLPFLDMLIEKHLNGTLGWSVYRKPTHAILCLLNQSPPSPTKSFCHVYFNPRSALRSRLCTLDRRTWNIKSMLSQMKVSKAIQFIRSWSSEKRWGKVSTLKETDSYWHSFHVTLLFGGLTYPTFTSTWIHSAF